MCTKKNGKRSDQVNQLMFPAAAKRPDYWFGNAESYKLAASILLETITKEKGEEKITPISNGKGGIMIPKRKPLPPVDGPYVHLIGVAIENELKAILITLAPEKFVTEYSYDNDTKTGYRLSEKEPRFTTHNLQNLAQMANEIRPCTIPLNEAKITTLKRLQLAIESGKYAIEKNSRAYDKNKNQLDLDIFGGKGGWPPKYKLTRKGDIDESSGDIAAFNKLFSMLEQTYYRLNSASE